MLVFQIAELQVLGAWLLARWQRLVRLLGGAGQPEEQTLVVSEPREMAGAPATRHASAQHLDFDTVLPGIAGRVIVSAGPGQSMVFRLERVRVSDVYGALQYLDESREGWSLVPEASTFAAYLALDGPGWELTIFVDSDASAKVGYYARKTSSGTPVTGVATWDALAQALLLSPDYEAVVGYLALRLRLTGSYIV